MTRTELTAKRAQLRRQLDDLERVRMTCESCIHLTERRVCSMFDAEPPAEAITTDIGCESWVHDEIPF